MLFSHFIMLTASPWNGNISLHFSTWSHEKKAIFKNSISLLIGRGLRQSSAKLLFDCCIWLHSFLSLFYPVPTLELAGLDDSFVKCTVDMPKLIMLFIELLCSP